MIKKKRNMATDTILSVRMKSSVKNKAKKVFANFGLDLSTGINMYLNDIVKGEVKPSSGIRRVPDHIMEKWEKEIKWAKKHRKAFNSVDELMADLRKL